MTKPISYDRDGNVISDATVMPDGGRIRVPHLLMDSAGPTDASMIGHRPGYMPVADGIHADVANVTREVKRELRLEKLSDAWRNPPSVATVEARKDAARVIPVVPDSELAAQRRDARLEQAWMGAGA